jgi:site-specific recombinase XerD
MSTPKSIDGLLIEKLRTHLKAESYSPSIQQGYPGLARHFLDYCDNESLSMEAIRSAHITRFLRREYRLFCQRHQGPPPPFSKWRWRYTSALRILLSLAHRTWPISDPPATALEAFHCDIIKGYDTWLHDVRGLHPETRAKRTSHAQRFLSSLGSRADENGLSSLCVRDVDAYVQQCCRGLRRASVEDYIVCLRDLLRHLHGSGWIAVDLSSVVIGPRIYAHEDIPSALRPEEVQRVLEVTRKDISPAGLRDYAILMLLATYGLRAAEIVRLRLEDVDWKRDLLRVRHSKTGTDSELPLLREPGEAVLRYLKKARPQSNHREVFLRLYAPYRPFKRGGILYSITRARLKAAAITPEGRRGSHAFRHARAVSLLRSGVSLKIIGDLLGHTSAQSTGEYLKLAKEDLRDVGLELPSGVSP